MMPSQARTYLLPRKSLSALTREPVAKLHLVLSLGDDEVPCTMLDTFDQRLLARDQVLLETPSGLELICRDGSAPAQAGQGAFVADLPQGPVKEQLRSLSPLRSLRPMGRASLERGVLALVDDVGKTRARAHLRLMNIGKRHEVILTLQPMRGYDKALEALRERLARFGARPLTRERLCDTLLPDLPLHAAEIDISPDATAYEAANAIIAAHLPVLTAHESGIIADHDTEFLHQYRVALRKIRLVLSLFKPVWRSDQAALLKTRFAALMWPTGPQRDLDVLLLDRRHLEALVPATLQGGLAGLFALIGTERQAAHRALADHLSSRAHRDETEALNRLINRGRLRHGKAADRPFKTMARDLIQTQRRALPRSIDPSVPDADLHALRLQIKTLRYLMDFLGEDSRPLRRLQDQLGGFNDICVAQTQLQALLSRHPEASQATAQCVGALIAALHAQAQSVRADVLAALAAEPLHGGAP